MNKIKGLFIMLGTLLYASLGVAVVPWLFLVLLNVMDYVTGLWAAPYRNPDDKQPIKSYKSIRGIYKKLCMHLLIILGWVIDIIIKSMAHGGGFKFTYPPIFVIIIALWLTFNEIISIIENVQDIGTPIPKWLMPLVRFMQRQVDAAATEKLNDEDE